MSDDQRMKDLADRLVAMSPEPPPFPEEVTVTQPSKSKPSPILMFAGAAVVVLILAAIPILLFSRGGGEVVATTTTSTVPATETTEQTVTTTTVAPTTTGPEVTTTVPPVEMEGVVVFLVQEPEGSFTGNPAVVPFFAQAVAVPGEPELAALRLLTTDELFLPDGFSSTIPPAVEVLGVQRAPEDHRITIDMNQAFLQGSQTGALGDFTMLNQLIFTVTSSEGGGFTEVVFTVEGQPVTQFGSEGLVLTDPVGRDSFLDQLNPVIVDSAATGTTGDSGLVMTGTANVFEAVVSLELVDESGSVVYEDNTMATCGSGCWGFYSFTIGFDFESTPVTLKVFEKSAQDGSPINVVSIPVLWGEPWDFLSIGS